jgi:hypothetical protein
VPLVSLLQPLPAEVSADQRTPRVVRPPVERLVVSSEVNLVRSRAAIIVWVSEGSPCRVEHGPHDDVRLALHL